MTPERIEELRKRLADGGADTDAGERLIAILDCSVALPECLDEIDRLSKREQRAWDLESELACTADMLNTWCRESQVAECKDPYGKLQLRDALDRMLSNLSGQISDLRNQVESLSRPRTCGECKHLAETLRGDRCLVLDLSCERDFGCIHFERKEPSDA